jgi:hypothetical protein
MKNLTLLLLFLATITQSVFAQTITGSFTVQPCNNDGVYTVNTTGLALPITYNYYYNGMTITHANVNSATDQLTNLSLISNGMFCYATSNGLGLEVDTQISAPFNFYTQATAAICPATTGVLNAINLTGSGPFTFLWTNEQTLQTYTGNNAVAPIGNYDVIITDQTTGCALAFDDSTDIYQQSNVYATMSSTSSNCALGISGTATATVSGGVAPYTYIWSNGANTPLVSNLGAGYYQCTAIDAQGCQSYNGGVYVEEEINISVNTTITNATCIQSNGSALAFGSGGVGPYTYTWSNGQTGNNAVGLSGPTNYNVIATDANGCVGTGSAYVNVSTPINVTYATTTSLCTAPTGSATLTITGGTAPYSIVWYTYPTQSTGLSITNVAPGNYSFQVTDAVGCVRTGTVSVNPVSNIFANISATNPTCPSVIGSADIYASGSNPPYTYAWSNGASTSQITGVPEGYYTCIVTDAQSCSVTKSTSINSISPVGVGTTSTNTTCIFATDGTASANAFGGTAPYTYNWSAGSTSPSIAGLSAGYEYVSVTDANGCAGYGYVTIQNDNTSTSCFCTISGKVYYDANGNCGIDGGDNGLENIMIHCSGFGYTFTDANGNYSFQVPTGSYTITQQINQYYPLAACQSNNIAVSVVAATGCTNTVNFANNIIVNHDLRITTTSSFAPPIPGNVYQQKLIVKNDGTVAEAGVQLGYQHDGQLPFGSSSDVNFLDNSGFGYPNWFSIQSGFPTLNPGISNVINLSYNAPTNIPLGTVIDFFDTVAKAAPIDTEWLLDQSPWNNVNTFQPIVVGSYDPNFKEVSPAGVGAQGYIASAVTELDYVIHFQNEGTYYAQNISVVDTLDADLDWTTLKPGYSQYDYTATVSETGVLTFKFADINLPWKSNFGDALSSALVTYSIKRKATNPQGTVFTNKADIYFDYNAPITTNTTTNTLNDALATIETSAKIEDVANSVSVDLYPVPARDVINIKVNNATKDEEAVLNIIDLTGKVVYSSKLNVTFGSCVVQQNIATIAKGTYLARIQFKDASFIVKKIVLQD